LSRANINTDNLDARPSLLSTEQTVVSHPMLSVVINGVRCSEPVFYIHCITVRVVDNAEVEQEAGQLFWQCDVLVQEHRTAVAHLLSISYTVTRKLAMCGMSVRPTHAVASNASKLITTGSCGFHQWVALQLLHGRLFTPWLLTGYEIGSQKF